MLYSLRHNALPSLYMFPHVYSLIERKIYMYVCVSHGVLTDRFIYLYIHEYIMIEAASICVKLRLHNKRL